MTRVGHGRFTKIPEESSVPFDGPCNKKLQNFKDSYNCYLVPHYFYLRRKGDLYGEYKF
jgi:hypothetical protein